MDDQLRTFVVCARHRSFTSAAAELGVAASTVSRSVRQLEDHLSVQLFVRTTRTVRLTEEGRFLMEGMKPLFEASDRLVGEVMADRRRLVGNVRISCTTAWSRAVVMPALEALLLAQPGLTFELDTTDRRVDLVAEGVDVAFRHGALGNHEGKARRVAAVTYRMYSRPNHCIHTLSDLDTAPKLTFDLSGFARSWRLTDGEQIVEVPVKARVLASGALPILDGCIRGLGVALLADWTVSEQVAAGRLTAVLPQFVGVVPFAGIWAVTPPATYLPQRVHHVIDAVGRAADAVVHPPGFSFPT